MGKKKKAHGLVCVLYGSKMKLDIPHQVLFNTCFPLK